MLNYQNDYYKKLDNNILNKHSNPLSIEQMQEMLKSFDEIDTASNYIESKLKSNKWTWHEDEKRRSCILGNLVKHKELFAKYGITLNKVITYICSIYNYSNGSINTKCNNFFKVPDRFLRYRTQLSRKTMNNLLYILNKIGIVELKYYKEGLYVKLNTKYIQQDIFILKNAKRNIKSDRDKLHICSEKYNSDFFEEYTHKTFLKNIKETAIGISIAYTELNKDIIFNKRLEDMMQYGERKDITYIEAPIHIISKILKVNKYIINKYLLHLTKCSNYFAKHNKVYQRKDLMDNYYTPLYKSCNLINSKNVELDKDHPIVTDNSYIIFNANFENTKTYKNIMQNIDVYKNIIIEILEYDSINFELDNIDTVSDLDTDLYNTTYLSKGMQTELNNKNAKSEIVYAENTSIIDLYKIHNSKKDHNNKKYIKFNNKNLTISSALKYIKKFSEIITRNFNLSDDDITNYNSKIKKLIEFVQNKIDSAKNITVLEKIKDIIFRENLSYCFKF